MIDKNYYIYCISINGNIIYYGCTNQPKRRIRNHINQIKRGFYCQQHIHLYLNKYIFKNQLIPIFYILESCINYDCAIKREYELIKDNEYYLLNNKKGFCSSRKTAIDFDKNKILNFKIFSQKILQSIQQQIEFLNETEVTAK